MKPKIYISERASGAVSGLLSGFGDVVFLKPFGLLPEGLSSHADMLIADAGRAAFCYPGYGIEGDFIRTDDVPAAVYPRDVFLNCTFIGNMLIANPKTLSKTVLEYAYSSGIELIPVRQGYSGCAVAKVGESALITADIGIARAAEDHFDVLLISPDGIALPGYDRGFIGGASASLPDRLVFFGDISLHQDGERIVSFTEAHGIRWHDIKGVPLTDLGGARALFPVSVRQDRL